MPSSIQLKACGGLPPYTWSKTGSVNLSSTTGKTVIVQAGSGDLVTFRVTFTTVANALCTTGQCGTDWPVLLSGTPQWAIQGFDCENNNLGSFNISAINLTCGSTAISLTGVCSGTLSLTCTGSCTGTGCSMADLSNSLTVSCGSVSDSLDHSDWILGRQSYDIGGANPTGATVTVTDAAGVSATYVVNA